MGSGTTSKMCILIERSYIGSEISKEYCDIEKRRLEKVLCEIKNGTT
jgi:site-specific DNA-methyltransferase (adenine-specific)